MDGWVDCIADGSFPLSSFSILFFGLLSLGLWTWALLLELIDGEGLGNEDGNVKGGFMMDGWIHGWWISL